MRQFAIIALSLMLSACWAGPDFYAETPSVQPIPAGKYKVVRNFSILPDDKEQGPSETVGSRIRLSYAEDGSVIIKGGEFGDQDSRPRIVVLDESQGLYVVQVDPGQGVASLSKRIYGLVRLTPDGYRLSVPLCDGTRRIKPGSRITVGGLLDKRRSCSYDDRETFETAMRKFADDPVSYTEYRRVKG
jgi:hypothetical protein